MVRGGGRQEVKMTESKRAVGGVRQSVLWWVEGREKLAAGGGERQKQQCEEETDGLHSVQIQAGLLQRARDQDERFRYGPPWFDSE